MGEAQDDLGGGGGGGRGTWVEAEREKLLQTPILDEMSAGGTLTTRGVLHFSTPTRDNNGHGRGGGVIDGF